MILFPAIDLKDGQCVRLLQGRMDRATVFGDDPGQQARVFQDAGCQWLHVVDLNGAFEGRPSNGAAVDAILASATVPVQLGGGIRDRATLDMWLDKGVARVILGTAALYNPTLVKEACRDHPGKVVVGVDARDGRVAVQGWAAVSELSITELALRFEDAGVAALIHTDISRDGMLTGANVPASAELARRISTPVIVSGGVSGLDDMRKVRGAADSGLAGVIAGRALYDGRLDLGEALKVLAGEDP